MFLRLVGVLVALTAQSSSNVYGYAWQRQVSNSSTGSLVEPSSATGSTTPAAITSLTATTASTLSSGSTWANITSLSTGTGSEYASQCSSYWVKYRSQRDDWTFYNATRVPYSSHLSTQSTTTVYNKTCFTLCDGHCRLNSTSISTTVGTTDIWFSGTTVTDTYPVPTPICRIASDDCYKLWTAWSSIPLDVGIPITSSLYDKEPPCPSPLSRPVCGNCYISAKEARLIYWSLPANVSRNMCATEVTDTPISGINYQQPPMPTRGPDATSGQLSAVVNGTTYWANSVYMWLKTVAARDQCGYLGPTYTTALVTMQSSEVISLRGFYGTVPYRFNFADMMEPVPYIAWVAQSSCRYPSDCPTIYPNQFNPIIALPPEVRLLNPSWENCSFTFRGIYDPPTALGAAVIVPDPTSSLPAEDPPASTTGGGHFTTPFQQTTPASPPPTVPTVPSRTITSTQGPDPQPTLEPSRSGSVDPAPSADPPGDPPADPSADPPANPPPPTVGETTIGDIGTIPVVINPTNPGGVVIGSSTLLPGQVTTLSDNIPVSVGTGVIVIGDTSRSTIVIPSLDPSSGGAGGAGGGSSGGAPANPTAVITIGTDTITASPGGITIGTSVLSVGGSAITTDGTTISLDSTGVVITDPTGTSTVTFSGGSPTGTGITVFQGGSGRAAGDIGFLFQNIMVLCVMMFTLVIL